MKVRLDKGRCAGHALCNGAGPDVFVLDADGYCAIDGDLDVPEGLEGQARAGVAACPERALTAVE